MSVTNTYFVVFKEEYSIQKIIKDLNTSKIFTVDKGSIKLLIFETSILNTVNGYSGDGFLNYKRAQESCNIEFLGEKTNMVFFGLNKRIELESILLSDDFFRNCLSSIPNILMIGHDNFFETGYDEIYDFIRQKLQTQENIEYFNKLGLNIYPNHFRDEHKL